MDKIQTSVFTISQSLNFVSKSSAPKIFFPSPAKVFPFFLSFSFALCMDNDDENNNKKTENVSSFVQVSYNEDKKTTKIKEDTLNPKWDEIFLLFVSHSLQTTNNQ